MLLHLDFTADDAITEAKAGWLTDKKYLAILLNPNHYTDLSSNMSVWINANLEDNNGIHL